MKGNLFEISSNYPAKGFVFQLEKVSQKDIQILAGDIFMITDFLSKNEIAYNVFITRGVNLEQGKDDQVLKIFVWARQSITGN